VEIRPPDFKYHYIGRILLVPIIVWAIASNQMEIAFGVFVIAGVATQSDGFLASDST